VSGRRLRLRERPLVVMEASLFGPQYMNLSIAEGLDVSRRLFERCRSYGGDFVVLWHNDHLIEKKHRAAYEELLEIMSDVR
jgi:hypothetical protein